MALSYAGKALRLVRSKDQEIAAKRQELADLIRARQELVRGYYGRRCSADKVLEQGSAHANRAGANCDPTKLT